MQPKQETKLEEIDPVKLLDKIGQLERDMTITMEERGKMQGELISLQNHLTEVLLNLMRLHNIYHAKMNEKEKTPVVPRKDNIKQPESSTKDPAKVEVVS